MDGLRAALAAVGAANAVTFLAFGIDKLMARRGGRRIPEARLLLLMFLTGFAGGWLGSALFRHKTAKTGFRLKMLLVTVLNPVWPLLWLWWEAARGGAQ